MRPPLLLTLLLLAGACASGCHRAEPATIAPAVPVEFVSVETRPRALLVVETEGPGGAAGDEAARALERLLAHFDEACDIVDAQGYQAGALARYAFVFYLAGKPDSRARTQFVADLARANPIAVWVGPGVSALGERAAALGLRETEKAGVLPGAEEWSISYKGRRRVERLPIPEVAIEGDGVVLSQARRGTASRPFVHGRDRLWYLAAGPSLAPERFWTTCIIADALHVILNRPHEGGPKRLVPTLRDVPVWATATQAPRAIRPMIEAGVPVAVLAWTNWGNVPLADRPEAVRGLRAAEALGATITLVADSELDPREHFRLAWEVGLHPVAWAGPDAGDNPFRLRIASPQQSPPFNAGGLLPAPIAISDAGYVSVEDAERLEMLEVVRDAVALVSFGLWATPEPFLAFLRDKQAAGWVVSDLRDLGVRVDDARRTLISGAGAVQVPGGSLLRKLTLGPRWQVEAEASITAAGASPASLDVTAPDRSVAAAELVRERPARDYVKGITLDPWAYGDLELSARELSEKLAERYRENGVNAVFVYAYNVNYGAAYRTRHSGATVSEWGRQDLLAELIKACHERDIRVIAWMYSGRDRGMWKKHSEWRERTRDGRDYNPLRLHAAYFLCPRNPQVREWYVGLLADLARRHPTLDGIELCEPVVNWFGDQACYCEVCRSEFARAHPGEPLGNAAWRRFRADGLTEFLAQCMRAIGEHGIESYIMTISDAWSNGAILSPRQQAAECGFDLDALLDGPYPPDWINFEIIWQQWAAIYGDDIFNYDWAEETARRLVRRVDGRARVLLHLEMTDFVTQHMTPEKMAKTIDRVKGVGADGIEIYHSRAFDTRSAWPMLRQAYEELP